MRAFSSYKVIFRIIVLSLIGFHLSSCHQLSIPALPKNSGKASANHFNQVKLNPAFHYMKVMPNNKSYHPGPSAFLALGRTEQAPCGLIKSWYSRPGEILQTCNGRIVGSAGLSLNWSSVRFDPIPSWEEANLHPIKYTRVRDVMPGYYFGITEKITLRKIATPHCCHLVERGCQTLTWFEESVTQVTPANMKIPPARFAVAFSKGYAEVVYSEQCLAPNQCYVLQEWS